MGERARDIALRVVNCSGDYVGGQGNFLLGVWVVSGKFRWCCRGTASGALRKKRRRRGGVVGAPHAVPLRGNGKGKNGGGLRRCAGRDKAKHSEITELSALTPRMCTRHSMLCPYQEKPSKFAELIEELAAADADQGEQASGEQREAGRLGNGRIAGARIIKNYVCLRTFPPSPVKEDEADVIVGERIGTYEGRDAADCLVVINGKARDFRTAPIIQQPVPGFAERHIHDKRLAGVQRKALDRGAVERVGVGTGAGRNDAECQQYQSQQVRFAR